MRINVLLFKILMMLNACFAQPGSFESRGIGGGGALFQLSLNPSNTNEYFVSCDMGELFHTTNFGISYEQIKYSELQGGHHSKVCYSSTPGLLYSVSHQNNGVIPKKSINNGLTWTTLPGNPDVTEETFSIFSDFNNSNRVIISYYGEIYFSSNGGNTFTLIHTALTGNGVVIGGAFFDGNNIYLGTNDGVLVSNNGGSSWITAAITGMPANERIWSFTAAKVGSTTRFFCLTGDVNDIYAGLVGSDYWGFAKGVYSVDYGVGNWVARLNGINLASDFPMFIDMAENDINTVYLAGSNDDGVPDILKTTNGGSSWTHVFNTTNNLNIHTGWSGQGGDRGWGYGECPFGFDVAATDANIIIFGDFGFVHKSSNGGSSWYQAYVDPLDQNPAGSTTPPYQDYKSNGIENTTNWQIHWINATTMWACYSDIRGIKSTDGGDKWSFNYTNHSANSSYRIVQHANGTLFMGTSNIHDIYQSTYLTDARLDGNDANGKIMYSINNGQSWQNLKIFNHPVFWIALDPNNPNRAYASVIHYANNSGIGGVYVTNDLNNLASSTWTLLPNPPNTEKHPASLVVLNDGTLVATYSGRRNASGTFTASSGVFKYSNSVWTDVSHSGMRYWTRDIIIDPNDANQNTWYVGVFSGWGGPPNGLGGLYKSTNRGASWTKLTGSTLDRVTSCTFNPQNPNQIFITTEEQGLWMSSDINQAVPTFQQVQSYPFQQPVRVFFNPFNHSEMWISSFGNGMKKGILYGENCHIVNNTNNSGTGSFQYALDCVAESDTVLFSAALSGDTIQLNNSTISLNKNVNIINNNAQKVFIKSSANSIFNVAASKNVWMENLQLVSDNVTRTTITNHGLLTLKNFNSSTSLAGHSKIINSINASLQLFGINQIK